MKKIIKRLKLIIALSIGFFVVIIFKILSIFKPFRFGIIYTARIGHLCRDVDAYLSIKKKNEITIFGTQKKIANKFIFEEWKNIKGLFFLNKIGVYGHFFLKTFLNKDKMMIQWNELYQNYSLFMLQKKNFISDQLKNDKRNLKKKIGIGESPYVCFHNRDEKYLRSIGGDKNQHEFRNFNFKDFKKSISFISKKKIKSIRVGRLTEKKNYKINNLNFIDFTNDKSNDFIDTFLIDNSEFLIASATGLSNLGAMLRKKILLVNTIPFCLREMYQYTKGSLFIPKKIYSNKEKRMLKLCEIERLKYNIHEKNFFKKRNLKVINNSEEEIYLAVKEMLENYKINNSKRYFNNLHNKFWNTIDDKRAVNIVRNKLRLNIADSFLKKNKSLI